MFTAIMISLLLLTIVLFILSLVSASVEAGAISLTIGEGTIGAALSAGITYVVAIPNALFDAVWALPTVALFFLFVVFFVGTICSAIGSICEIVCACNVAFIAPTIMAVFMAGMALICPFTCCIDVIVFPLYIGCVYAAILLNCILIAVITDLSVGITTLIFVVGICVQGFAIIIEIIFSSACIIIVLTCTGGAGVGCCIGGLIVFTLETFVYFGWIIITVWCIPLWCTYIPLSCLYILCLAWTCVAFPCAVVPFFLIAFGVAAILVFICLPSIIFSVIGIAGIGALFVMALTFGCVTTPAIICLSCIGSIVALSTGFIFSILGIIAGIILVIVGGMLGLVIIIFGVPSFFVLLCMIGVGGSTIIFLAVVTSTLLGIPLGDIIRPMFSIFSTGCKMVTDLTGQVVPCVTTERPEEKPKEPVPQPPQQPLVQLPVIFPQLANLTTNQILAGGVGILAFILIIAALL